MVLFYTLQTVLCMPVKSLANIRIRHNRFLRNVILNLLFLKKLLELCQLIVGRDRVSISVVKEENISKYPQLHLGVVEARIAKKHQTEIMQHIHNI